MFIFISIYFHKKNYKYLKEINNYLKWFANARNNILFKYKIILNMEYILIIKISWWINKYKLHKNWFIRKM